MKLTIPKNRILPIILFAIAGTLLPLLLGIYYMNNMVKNGYQETISNYDAISEKTAKLIKEDMNVNLSVLNTYAGLIGQSGVISREQSADILPLLLNDDSFIDLTIVNTDGKGFNLAGDSLDKSNETAVKNALSGNTQIASEESSDNGFPSMVYTVPVISGSKVIGVLQAKKSAQLDELSTIENSFKENSVIYVVNEDNKLVSYMNEEEAKQYDYDQITGSLNTDNSVLEEDKLLNNLFGLGNSQNDFQVWFKKPLGINNWSVLLGKTDILNPTTRNIIKVSSFMWIGILVSIFLLFLMLIIFQIRSNRKLIQMLYLDPVTGGNNWYKFRLDVNKILNSRSFFKKRFALVNFDINRFKIINDSFGHQKGDEVLKDIYYIIKKWIRSGERFTRYSADQFYILLSFHEDDEVTDRIMELNNKLHQLKFTRTVKFYFGVYYITGRRDSIDRMGDFAGIAKNNIKGSNEGIISFFDDNARVKLLEEERIEKSMYDALKNNEFVVYLQPKYDTISEQISGAEALVRWYSGSGNIISPGYFIPVFEKNGFIIELDHYMLKNICMIQRGWLDKGLKPLPVSVNISRINFTNPHLADIIKDIVDTYNVPHELIELELTESAFLQNKQVLIDTVTQLRQYGFTVSMDDFGAGYSSLNSLKDIPLDVVKLDGELFRITEELERGQTVIRNTISMAKDLHMKVVAECIETREQVEFLCTVGCDIIQGYYYAKPMPVEQFENQYLMQLEN